MKREQPVLRGTEQVLADIEAVQKKHIKTAKVLKEKTDCPAHNAEFRRCHKSTYISSSPIYPQANREAKQAVTTVEGLWKAGEDKLKALMTYHATPLESVYSPAQLLIPRQLCTSIPQLPAMLCWVVWKCVLTYKGARLHYCVTHN